jgi:hypothetical protein
MLLGFERAKVTDEVPVGDFVIGGNFMLGDEIDGVGADNGAVALGQATELVVEGTIPYYAVGASQEAVNGLLDTVGVVDVVDNMLEGGKGRGVLGQFMLAGRAAKRGGRFAKRNHPRRWREQFTKRNHPRR